MQPVAASGWPPTSGRRIVRPKPPPPGGRRPPPVAERPIRFACGLGGGKTDPECVPCSQFSRFWPPGGSRAFLPKRRLAPTKPACCAFPPPTARPYCFLLCRPALYRSGGGRDRAPPYLRAGLCHLSSLLARRQQLAFTAQYDGNTEVYLMPAEGGPPTPADLHRDAAAGRSGRPHGAKQYRHGLEEPKTGTIVFRSRMRSFNPFIGQLYLASDRRATSPRPCRCLRADSSSFSG